MSNWIIQTVIAFVLRQIAKFGDQTDWAKIKVDIGQRISQLLPFPWMYPGIMDLVNGCIDALAEACKETADLQAIVSAVIANDWGLALDLLGDLLQKVMHPAAKDLQAAVHSMKAAGVV